MPYSYQSHVLASSSAGPFSFAAIDGYLSIDHIKVYVDETLEAATNYTVDEVLREITLTSALPAGAIVLIRRETPKTLSERQVVFTAGSVVRTEDLNRAHLQTMFIAQETEDQAVKDLQAPSEKAAGQVLTWTGTIWAAAEPTGGSGGGITPGLKGDIEVVTASDWQIRPATVTTGELGGDITSAGKSLIIGANAAAQRTTLGLGTAATQNTTAFAAASHTHPANQVTGLSTVATSGSYTDLTNRPTLGTAAAAATTDFAAAIHTHSNATTSADGFMSSQDKTKLNGVASGAEVNVNADWNASSGDAQILNKPTLGTVASLNVPASAGGVAGSTQAVRGDDPRLADSRSPTTHTHTASDITSGLATVATSGSYTDLINKASIPSLLGDLTDVSSTAPTTGQVLKWNGSVWAPGTDATQGGGGNDADTLDGLDSTHFLNRANHTGTQAISTITDLQSNLDGKAATSHTHTLSAITNAGTAAARDVPASGNAGIVSSVAQVVIADDTRLTDARTPTSHTHGSITNDGRVGAVSGRVLVTKTDGAVDTLPEGSANQFLRKDSSNTIPIWDTPKLIDSYVGQIDEPKSTATYWVDRRAATARTITGFYARCASGTVTLTLYSGETGTTEIGQVGVTSSGGSDSTLTNTSISADGVMRLKATQVDDATEVTFVIKYEITL
jgi:hypothetical protein